MVTKKKTVGKTANKKVSGLTRLKKKVPEDKRFVVSNGEVIGSLKELALELDNMADDIFSNHVNKEKNDFYNWIRDGLKETDLAENLKNANKKKDLQLKLLKHMVKKI